MKQVQGIAKTVNGLLKDVKYYIDYYQREYRWQGKQIRELVDDLTGKFLEAYDAGHERKEVAKYPHYWWYVKSCVKVRGGSWAWKYAGTSRFLRRHRRAVDN